MKKNLKMKNIYNNYKLNKMNSSSVQFNKFLKEKYVDGVYYTHVSMVNPRGKYQLNRDSFEEFWKLYNEAVFIEKENFIIGLAEKPQNYIPVLCDIDIKKTEEDMDYLEVVDNHIYTEKNLRDVVEIYQSVLRNIIEDCTDDHLLCVVLEKDMYTIVKNGLKIFKSGFHLQFPNCFLSKNEHENHLIPRIKDHLKKLNVFSNLNYEDSSEVFDSGYLKAPWLLYGSRKEGEHMKPYKITKIINSEGENITLEEAFRYYNVFNISDQLIDMKDNIELNLPRILSILPSNRTCSEIKYGLPSPVKEKQINKKYKIEDENEEEKINNENSINQNLSIAKKLLSMVSDFRADDRNNWLHIGWILHSIGDGCDEALQLWIDFSSRCEDKFDENECINQWKKMTKKDNGLKIGTLHYYAKLDNEEMYKEMQIENAKKHIEEGIEGSHNDIAKLMHVFYGTDYICSSITNKTWFQFKNHHWEEIEGGIFLREKISSEIVRIFGKHGGEVFYNSSLADKSEDKSYATKIKQFQKLISNLKNSPYKTNIMNEACEVFFNKDFKDKLDTNPYLIGFKNGVYDLKLNIFRAGIPEDYISKQMPINYINFKKTDKRVLDVYDYLEKVFPDTSIRNYFLDTSSDVFEGGNKQKIIIFWTGEGDNAKSVTQTILERMLGSYAIKFSTTLVTGKKTSIGMASPELSRAGGGVRWAVLEEPDGDEELNVGMLKSLSGNDSFWARDLFEKGKSTKETVPLFKLIFVCNKLIKIKHADKAFWNRVKVLPFETTFVRPGQPCPETYEEQLKQKKFPMDPEFNKKIQSLLEPMCWLLLEHRKSIQGKGRIEPEKVKMATNMYRKQNDIYRQFIDECIVEADKYITLTELYEGFLMWYKMGYPKHTTPIRNDVQEYFTKLWDEPEKGLRWHGYRIKSADEQIESGDIIVLGENDIVDYNKKANKCDAPV